MREDANIDKERLLARGFLFEALDSDTRQKLADMGHIRRFKSGELIFREGAPGESMMAIAEGVVRISQLAPSAREVVLAELSEGDVFGEISVLDGRERSGDAHALTNCVLVVIERRALLEMMRTTPTLAQTLIEILCARIRRSDERMMEIGFLPIPARLAMALLRASGPKDNTGGPSKQKLSLSQGELANMIGSSRENVNRCLRKWQIDGVVELKDGWIVIPDRSALVRLAEVE